MGWLGWVVLYVVVFVVVIGLRYAWASTKTDKPLPPSMSQPEERN